MKGSDIFMAFEIYSWAAFPKGHVHLGCLLRPFGMALGL